MDRRNFTNENALTRDLSAKRFLCTRDISTTMHRTVSFVKRAIRLLYLLDYMGNHFVTLHYVRNSVGPSWTPTIGYLKHRYWKHLF